jgi:uncharacterized OB-fold protein
MGNRVSINEFVLDISGDEPRLLGGRCKACGSHTFPLLSGCARCAGWDMEAVPLSTKGTLWAWTVQGFPPKDPPYLGETDPEKFQPFGVGYIELPELKIEARLTESEPAMLKDGMEMQLTLEPLYTNEAGDEVVTFAFTAVE